MYVGRVNYFSCHYKIVFPFIAQNKTNKIEYKTDCDNRKKQTNFPKLRIPKVEMNMNIIYFYYKRIVLSLQIGVNLNYHRESVVFSLSWY